jgi:hypothetical protein
MRGLVAVVEHLLQFGADPNAEAHSSTPLSLAVFNSHPAVLVALLHAGADVRHKANALERAVMRWSEHRSFSQDADMCIGSSSRLALGWRTARCMAGILARSHTVAFWPQDKRIACAVARLVAASVRDAAWSLTALPSLSLDDGHSWKDSE